MIEPDIGRKFGIVISEDDFSDEGQIEYKEPTINDERTDLEEVYNNLSRLRDMINEASSQRDHLKKKG